MDKRAPSKRRNRPLKKPTAEELAVLRERAERMRINDDHLASCWMNVKLGVEDGSIALPDAENPEQKDGADA